MIIFINIKNKISFCLIIKLYLKKNFFPFSLYMKTLFVNEPLTLFFFLAFSFPQISLFIYYYYYYFLIFNLSYVI